MVYFQGMGWSEPGTAKEAAREGWRLRHPVQRDVGRNDGIDESSAESNRMSGSCYPVNPTRLPGPCAPVFLCPAALESDHSRHHRAGLAAFGIFNVLLRSVS
jgi:hypothetical protein